MATFDLTAAADALKIWFQDPITDQVVADADFLAWFTQNTRIRESDFGKFVEVADIFGDPEGVGARAEGDYIPEALNPQFKRAQIYLKYLYGTVQLTKQTMTQMRLGRAAFLDWAEAELTRLVRAMRNNVDRMLYGFGAGHIARVSAISGTTITVNRAYGVTGLGGAAALFRVGASYVFFSDAGSTTKRSAGGVLQSTVTNINRATQQVTFNAVPTDLAVNDFIVRGDSVGHSGQKAGVDREIMGLLGMVDDGAILATYFGVARSTYSPFRAQVINGGAAPYNGNLVETLLMFADDEAELYGGGNPDAIITTRGVLRNFFKQLRADRSLNDPRTMTGGTAGLRVLLGDKELTLKATRQAPAGSCYLLDRSTLIRAHNTGWEWADETGSMWKQVTDATGRKDEFYAYGRWFLQTFCNSPQKNARIDGLNEAVA